MQAGFATELEPWEAPTPDEPMFDADLAEEAPPEYVPRAIVQHVINRKFRDARFRRHVRSAYDKTCAVTGLRLINGGGRPEVEAAHIRPVENDGPVIVAAGASGTTPRSRCIWSTRSSMNCFTRASCVMAWVGVILMRPG